MGIMCFRFQLYLFSYQCIFKSLILYVLLALFLIRQTSFEARDNFILISMLLGSTSGVLNAPTNRGEANRKTLLFSIYDCFESCTVLLCPP